MVSEQYVDDETMLVLRIERLFTGAGLDAVPQLLRQIEAHVRRIDVGQATIRQASLQVACVDVAELYAVLRTSYLLSLPEAERGF